MAASWPLPRRGPRPALPHCTDDGECNGRSGRNVTVEVVNAFAQDSRSLWSPAPGRTSEGGRARGRERHSTHSSLSKRKVSLWRHRLRPSFTKASSTTMAPSMPLWLKLERRALQFRVCPTKSRICSNPLLRLCGGLQIRAEPTFLAAAGLPPRRRKR